MKLRRIEVEPMEKGLRVGIIFDNVTKDGYAEDGIYLDISEDSVHIWKTIRDGGESIATVDSGFNLI